MQYQYVLTIDRTVLLNCRSKGDKLSLYYGTRNCNQRY